MYVCVCRFRNVIDDSYEDDSDGGIQEKDNLKLFENNYSVISELFPGECEKINLHVYFHSIQIPRITNSQKRHIKVKTRKLEITFVQVNCCKGSSQLDGKCHTDRGSCLPRIRTPSALSVFSC